MVLEKVLKPNKKQQECIENIDGQIMVLAGPGTGKTYTLIQRVKNMLLNKAIPAEKILCLTFSDAAAAEMKKRLIKEVGELAAETNVYTYHSFCNELLNNYSDEFDFPKDTKIIDEATKRTFVKKCIDELNPKHYRTEMYDSYHFIPKIIEGIEEIKKNLITQEEYFCNIEQHPDWMPKLNEFKEKLEEKIKKGDGRVKTLLANIESQEERIGKAKELWSFYEIYKSMMQKQGLIDFNDMINLVLEAFKHKPAFLEKVANSYDYFLVDEYQDTNKSQNAIVFNLVKASNKKNIFVVGDDDQIIYGFQGAQIDNIEKFLDEFTETNVICLKENMRSTQSILDFSYEVSKLDPKRLESNTRFKQYLIDKKLEAKNDSITLKDKKVKFNRYADIDQEYISIVEEIESIINSVACPVDENGNKKLSEMVILAKTNKELEIFSEMFKARNIPYELKDGKSIFTIKSSILIFFYIKMLVNPGLYSEKIFQLLLNEPFNIDIKDYEELLKRKRLHKNNFFIDDIKQMTDYSWVNKERIDNILNTYEELQKYKNNESLKNIVLEIANRTGILKYFINSDINKAENISGIKKIIDEAKNLQENDPTVSLEDFAAYLNMAFESDIDILTDKNPVPLNAIQLVTYHSSKGREFEYVYMPTLETRKWESDNKSAITTSIPISAVYTEEEKKALKFSERVKLLFVGITRAKYSLTLSFPDKINGKDKQLSKLVLPFMNNPLLEVVEHKASGEDFVSNMIKLVTKKQFDYKKELNSYFKARVEDVILSATSINTYIKCPRQFLYSNVLKLDSKDSNKNSLNYGTSVHFACEKLFDKAKENNKYPTKDEFIGWFEESLSNKELSDPKVRKDFLERGINNLSKFYVQLTNTPVKNLYEAEHEIRNFKVINAPITGAIDRIEKNEDGTYSLYDYKTGKSKAKDIKDGGAHEDYLNQLRIYKYCFEKSTGNKVSKTGFLFPDDCENNYNVCLNDEDNTLIEQKITGIYNNLQLLNFEPKRDDEKVCEYCNYKDFCELNVL